MTIQNAISLTATGLISADGAGGFFGRTLSEGTAIDITNGDGVSGNPTISFDVTEIGTLADTFAADSGTAAPAANTLTVAGGTGLSTSATGSTVTITLDTPVTVANGGTSLSTITDHGIMLGSGTGAVTPTAAPTNGQLLIGSTGVDPVLASLTGGTGLSVVDGAGSSTINLDTPVTVANGGTAAATLTGVLTGNGTSAVTANAITEGAVLLAGASNAVTDTGVLAKGVLLVGDGATAPTLLAVGTDTHVLTADAAEDSGVKWAAAGGGGGGAGWVFLTSAVASDDATVDFASSIDSTYDNYVFTLSGVYPATDDVILQIVTSTDGGSTYDTGASDYQWIVRVAASSTIADWADQQDGADVDIHICGTTTSGGGVGNSSTNGGINGFLYMYDPSNAGQNTVFGSDMHFDDDGDDTALHLGTGRRQANEDVDAIRFFFSSGNISSGTIRLYGISNS